MLLFVERVSSVPILVVLLGMDFKLFLLLEA
jgi:hypothetical protein